MDEAKLELTGVWLKKALHDLIAARTLAASDQILDVAIYHCQQAAEKAIKGFLVYNDIRFEKIHDVKILVSLSLPVAPNFAELLGVADRLTDYATEFRYPGEILEPTHSEFQKALGDAELIFKTVVAYLPDTLLQRQWGD